MLDRVSLELVRSMGFWQTEVSSAPDISHILSIAGTIEGLLLTLSTLH